MAYTTINKPSEYFNTVLYTGDGSSPRSLTGVNFQPDWVWLKRRNDAASHTLYDVVRTAGSTKGIATNSTAQEGLTASEGTTANFGYINSFDSDGFSVTTGASSDGYVNNSSDTYVAWNWLADNTSGSSNTDGDITSTVSANTTSGFSIVSYTGTGSNATVGHGLGVAPSLIITKSLVATQEWCVYHKSLGATKYLFLNETSAEQTGSVYWQDTAPTSSEFSVGTSGPTNSTSAMIAYCFAEKKGFSKFGSYVGNGSTNGVFCYTGFKPAFIITKKTSATDNWILLDNKRDIAPNPHKLALFPNLADAEAGDYLIDFLSNGFKIRSATGSLNTGSGSYIYMAFAEEPLVGTNNIPATAR